MKYDPTSKQGPRDVIEAAKALADSARRVELGDQHPSFFDNLKTADFLDRFAEALAGDSAFCSSQQTQVHEQLVVALLTASLAPDP